MDSTFMIVALMGALLALLVVLLTRYVDVGVAGEPAQLRQQLDAETRKIALLTQTNRQLQSNNNRLQQRIAYLEERQVALNEEKAGWQKQLESDALRQEAGRILREAEERRDQINSAMRGKLTQVDERLTTARAEAAAILAAARRKAEEIAGEAYAAQARTAELKAVERALRRAVEGYGALPQTVPHGWIDDLAGQHDHVAAGEALRHARAAARQIVLDGRAVEHIADGSVDAASVDMLVESFNSRVSDILMQAKGENYPQLAQGLRDAWVLVNRLGGRFAGLQISEEYFDARLTELQQLGQVMALRQRNEHEQRWHESVLADENAARTEHTMRFRMADEQTATVRKAMASVRQLARTATGERAAQLQAKLSELHEKLVRAERVKSRSLSMMNRSRAGFVFIVSSAASLGEGVYHIGMTRRVDARMYLTELGLHALPFGFDVHLLSFSTDALTLVHGLHMRFLAYQVNKVNPDKRFYRVALADIRAVCEELGVLARWEMQPRQLEFLQTRAIEAELAENPELAKTWREKQLGHAAAMAPRKGEDEGLQTIIPVEPTQILPDAATA